MKWNLLFGTLVLSVGLCAQSQDATLLNRMLGSRDCGCASASCCEPACGEAAACCEPACGAADPGCCESACAPCGNRRGLLDHLFARRCGSCCEPACGAAADGCCDPGCGAADPGCCEPACGAAASGCCESACRPSLRDRLRAHLCNRASKSCCEPACGAVANDCCEPACGAVANGCCESACAPACRPTLRDRLSRLFPCHRNRCGTSGCCEPACGAPSCTDPGCCTSCTGCANGGVPTSTKEAPEGEAESNDDVPPAPVVDPSAFLPTARIIQASHTTR